MIDRPQALDAHLEELLRRILPALFSVLFFWGS